MNTDLELATLAPEPRDAWVCERKRDRRGAGMGGVAKPAGTVVDWGDSTGTHRST